MARADPRAAPLFFGSFMFFITNMILWMFLAIIIDYYSEVRSETRGQPSALADLVAATREIPAAAAALRARARLLLPPSMRANGGVSLDGEAEPDAPVGGAVLAPLELRISLARVEELLSRPPLLRQALITPADLAGPLVAAPEDVEAVLASLAPWAGFVIGGGQAKQPGAQVRHSGVVPAAGAQAQVASGGAGAAQPQQEVVAVEEGAAAVVATAALAATAAVAAAAAAPVGGQSVAFGPAQRSAAAAAFATARVRAREPDAGAGGGGAPMRRLPPPQAVPRANKGVAVEVVVAQGGGGGGGPG